MKLKNELQANYSQEMRKIEPPDLNKKKYLVNNDCVKDKISICYWTKVLAMQTLQPKKSKTQQPMLKQTPTKMRARKKKKNLKKSFSHWEETRLNKEKLSNPINLPSQYKKYKVVKKKIMVTKPKRTLTTPIVSYDGLEDTKRIDLATLGEESKLVHIVVS